MTFKASWGTPLKVMTILSVGFCGVFVVVGLMIGTGGGDAIKGWGLNRVPHWSGWLMAAGPALTVLACALFTVRGYTLTDSTLSIARLGWSTTIPIVKLLSATVDPTALKGSIRLCGNGGLFGFTGWFRNSKLGVFRLFATDIKNSVVLKFADRVVVISPDEPQQFAAEIMPRVARLRGLS